MFTQLNLHTKLCKILLILFCFNTLSYKAKKWEILQEVCTKFQLARNINRLHSFYHQTMPWATLRYLQCAALLFMSSFFASVFNRFSHEYWRSHKSFAIVVFSMQNIVHTLQYTYVVGNNYLHAQLTKALSFYSFKSH